VDKSAEIKTEWFISGTFVTANVRTVWSKGDEILTDVPPMLRKFRGQPLKNLFRWIKKKGETPELSVIGTDWVVHCKKSPYDVYIGRPSKWGNPFRIGKDGDRAFVIWEYREYLVGRRDLLDNIKQGELNGKVLGCWCRPQPCHGDVLVHLSWLLMNGEET
jgi:hypothetical protein